MWNATLEGYRLSPQQERLWELRESGQARVYCTQAAIQIRGKVDLDRIKVLLQRVVDRHEILRTTFHCVPGVTSAPLQVISRSRISWAPTEDMSDGNQRLSDLDFEQLLNQARARPFDLEQGPLVRAKLLKISAAEFVLLLTLPALCADARSLRNLVQELGHDHGQLNGKSAASQQSIQYADFCEWQKSLVESAHDAPGPMLWTQLDLVRAPTVAPSSAVEAKRKHNFEPLSVTSFCSPEDTRRIEAVAVLADTHPSIFLLTCWMVLLSRLTSRSDMILSLGCDGRKYEELQSAIGLYAKHIPFRCRLQSGETFLQAMQRLGGLVDDIHASQEYFSWEQIAGEAPFVPLSFEYEGEHEPVPSGEVSFSILKLRSHTERFGLKLCCGRSGESLRVEMLFAPDIYPEQDAQRWTRAFHTIIEGVLDTPELTLDEIDVVDGTERKTLLRSFNETKTPTSDQQLIHAWFECQADAVRDRIAVIFGDHCLTYGELDRRSNQLAHHLTARGVGPETAVALCLEESLEEIIAILGILKAGGAYIPLDPATPPNRAAAILEEAGARLVLTQARLAQRLPVPPENRICLDQGEAIAQEPMARCHSDVEPDNLAYIIFTSGTAGRPKGVMVSHRNLVHSTHARRIYYRGDIRAYLLVTSTAFDSSIAGIFGTLCQAGTLILGRCGGKPDLAQLGSLIRDYQVSHTLMIPALFSELLSESSAGTLASLKTAIVAGEACPPAVTALHHQTIPDAALVNEYGPTEGTVWATAFACSPRGKGALVPIGRPVANTQIYLLDTRLRPVPIGCDGELHLGGGGVARGYVGRSADTAASFIPDPFGTAAGGRLYKTKDHGRYQGDGNIVFLGRLDHQVKLRGVRIELQEVEAVLAGHRAVRECVVVARKDAPGQEQLAAYVVAKRGEQISEDELRTFMADSLMPSMVPDAFVFLNALPRTLNAKVDRALLPEPNRRAARGVPATTATEKKLAEIWAELLGFKEVGIRDSFFDLGGHSLMAITLMARIQKQFRVDLPLSTLFRTRTIEQLAKAVEERACCDDLETSSAFLELVSRPEDRHKPFLLNAIQQAYWIGRHQAFELGNVGSTNYFEWEVEALDTERLSAAIQALIARHDMLGAVILADGQIKVQDDLPSFELEIVDLRGMGADASEHHLQAVRRRMSRQTLKTDQWPPYEIRIHRLEDRFRLHVCFDLVMFDAVSSNILVQELYRLYHTPQEPLEPLEITFRDYAVAERALRGSPLYARAQAYWSKQIATLPPPPALPVVRNPQEIARPRFETLIGELDRETWDRLKARAAPRALTSTGLLCAAYAEVLAHWSKSRQFTLNLTTYHRIPFHPQVDNLVGDFTSLTMLAVDSQEASFEGRARSLQERLWGDLDHFYYSGVEVLRELRRRHPNSSSAIMPVVFTSQLGVAVKDDARARAWMGQLVHSSGQAPQVWLDHQVTEKDGLLSFWWDYLPELFPDGLVANMFDAYRQLLKRLADDEDCWHQHAPSLVTDANPRAQTRPVGDAPRELLHSAFLAQSLARSMAPAVVTSRGSLTYHELERRSLAVAHRLRALGARPNTLVAIILEPGWEQVVAVLAILRFGAAYLPVDPALPAERQQFMLEHAQVEFALTQSWLEGKQTWPKSVQLIPVDQVEAANGEEEFCDFVQRPEETAYIIYTSGSTGQPKGVIISHQAAANTISDINRRFRVGKDDRVLAVSSLSFDLSVYDIFGPLSAGGTIIIPDKDKSRDVSHWEGLIQEQKVTLWNSVPALMDMLVTHAATYRRTLPSSLRLALLSGDWIPLSLPQRLQSVAEQVEIISLGGATEASIWSILYPIKQVDPNWPSIPYGQAMENQTVEILDEGFKPCPVWVTGPIFIGGAGLSDGYWRDEARTRERFIVHPETGQRLFRTGDLGRYLPDGNIEFLGREDFQIKISGYRIELGEIEQTLEKHPAVASAVLAAQGKEGSKRLLAYIVPRKDRELTGDLGIPENSPSQESATRLIASPVDRLQFTLKQPGLRRDNHRDGFQLLKPEANSERHAAWCERRTHRQFGQKPVLLDRFSTLLASLMQMSFEDVSLPKYRYASAGSLYPVQTYICVKPDRVAGVPAGTYYYHPREHRLELLSADAQIASGIYHRVNQPIADAAAFSLFLIGQLDAIAPMYGEAARDFCLIEAGYMGQLLMTAAATCGLGLCPIGGVDPRPLPKLFQLSEGHVLLHSFLGGESLPATTGMAKPAAHPVGATPGQELAETLRAFLKEKLPAYMLPSEFIFLEHLPLTSNGKVDRASLPMPKRRETKQVFVAAETPLEQLLVELWKELLGVEKISLNDDFFRLGGNSLMAVQFINRVHQVLDVDVPLDTFLSSITIADLVAVIETQRPEASTSWLDKLEQLSDEDVRVMLQAKQEEAERNGKGKTLDQV